MDLFWFQGRFGNESLGGHAKVAVGMIRRNVALVAEENLHFVPGELRAKGIAHEERVQSLRSGTAGKRYAKNAAFAHRLLRGVHKNARRLLSDGRNVRQNFDRAFQMSYSPGS